MARTLYSTTLPFSARLLHGKRWKRPLAQSLGVDERLVRRWAAGERPLPVWLLPRLVKALRTRAEEIEAEIARLTD